MYCLLKVGISLEMILSLLIILSVGHWKAYTKGTALINCLFMAMGTMIILLQLIVCVCGIDFPWLTDNVIVIVQS